MKKFLRNAGFRNVQTYVKKTDFKEEDLFRIHIFGLGTPLAIWLRVVKYFFTRKESRCLLKTRLERHPDGLKNSGAAPDMVCILDRNKNFLGSIQPRSSKLLRAVLLVCLP